MYENSQFFLFCFFCKFAWCKQLVTFIAFFSISTKSIKLILHVNKLTKLGI